MHMISPILGQEVDHTKETPWAIATIIYLNQKWPTVMIFFKEYLQRKLVPNTTINRYCISALIANANVSALNVLSMVLC